VLSGPSGVGKDTLIERIHGRSSPERFAVPITMTTRLKRSGEVDGVDYLFVTSDEFRRRLDAGELLEHAEVYGHHYGVPRSGLREALALGHDVIMRVDVQGAATLKGVMPDAVLIFLEPDDPKQIERRLRERGTDTETIQRRLAAVQIELAARDQFDHVVVNVEGDLDGTVERVLAIVAQERARPGRRPVEV
jgi:guanylate kinase